MLCDGSELVPAFGVLLGIEILIFEISVSGAVIGMFFQLDVYVLDDRIRDLDHTLEAERAVRVVRVAAATSFFFSLFLSLSIDFAGTNRGAELRIVTFIFVDPAAERILDLALPFTLRLLFSTDVVIASIAAARVDDQRMKVSILVLEEEIFFVPRAEFDVILLEELRKVVAEVENGHSFGPCFKFTCQI